MVFRGRSHTVRAVLALFAVCLVVPATLAIGAMVTWNVLEVRRAKEAELLALARSASMTVDLRVSHLATLADAVATSDPVRGGDWAAARARIARLALGPALWVAISDGQGRRLLNTNPAAPATPPAARLPRPPDVAQAARTLRPVTSDLFLGWSTGRQVVAVSQGVRGRTDQAVVTVVADPGGLLPRADEVSAPPDATVTVVDRRYRVIARSRNHGRWQGTSATPQMISAMRRSSDGVVASRSLDGDRTIVAYTRSPVTGWTTMVVVPQRAILTPVMLNGAALAILALALLALGIGLSRLFGAALIRDLHRLEADAAELGHGRPVARRRTGIENIDRVQAALADASRELEVRGSRQELMINELNHRVKNTLATVQSLALQTFRSPGAEAPAKFDKRLAALADAHDLLTQSSWRPVDIRAVVERCAKAAGDSLRWSGPPAILPAQTAVALCMCLHELLTNAMKYGSLSTPGGEVRISWTRDGDGEIDLLWQEAGGPPVGAPERQGFGTRLIDRLSRAEMGGEISRDYAADGLRVRLRIAPSDADRWSNDFR